MKSIPRRYLLVLLLIFLAAPSPISAAPQEVTLFPDSARVTELFSVALQPAGGERFRGIVTIPGQAQPETLRASLSPELPQRIIDQTWRQVLRQDDVRLSDLRRQLQAVKTERITLFATMQALEAQILFWQAQAKGKAKTLQETDAFALLLGKNVKKAFQDKLSLEPQLQKLDERIKLVQEEIDRIIGQKESLWEVTFLFTGPAVRELPMTLDYVLSGCGWTPLYRLDARPRSGTILFAWEAEIWQSSGMDWKKVAIRLATLPPRMTLSPPPLSPWIIRPRPPLPPPRARTKADLHERAPEAGLLMASENAEEPREIRQSTYALWRIGERDIPAGARQRIKVREESWPADFVHLLRPALTPQAFVQAAVRLGEPQEIPSGQATYLIDGAILAKRPFSFAGQEGTLFFGVDPLVGAASHLLSRKAGEKGFVSERQSQEWVWRYDLRNDRPDSIQVRLEDPPPQVRDERIKSFLKYDIQPSITTVDMTAWNLVIPAGGKASLTSTIRLEAPREMDLDLGWRR